ncbi:hypothetical protein D3C76_1306460 [compost metagenome]
MGNPPGNQRIVFGLPSPQHAIYPFAQQIDVGVVGPQSNFYLWIALIELIQRRDDDFPRQRMGHIDPYLAGGL